MQLGSEYSRLASTRIDDIDPLQCSSCGGRMRFVEVIEDVGRARTEFARRGLHAGLPPVA